jgi:hypothetical protein
VAWGKSRSRARNPHIPAVRALSLGGSHMARRGGQSYALDSEDILLARAAV